MTITLTTFYECHPKEGSRFVAFYGDGGGASLFMRDDAGNYFDAEGDLVPDADWFMDSGHVWYDYLPDDFQLWFEQSGEKP